MTTEFSHSLGRLATDLPGLDARQAGLMIGRLRVAALAEGLGPVAEVADGLAAALIRDRAGTPIGAWIDAIRHAAVSPPGSAPLLLATVGARMGH